ncbi:CPBP family intramembrane glutamic endopeptidase [Paenibacillus sp.]|uniref:CPBP family intramembrane glutamic endopeptidase n=1 Tax=Paenibacillus sp. TaxID=58172 RepID=UPI002D345433|nr:CPBP family intramembrane glutamic endopeptidase [Paenibacillus sp.]HZG86570.1 CPBP family intramembrane glutamic endopeptidase [Paenibacillus sp.]
MRENAAAAKRTRVSPTPRKNEFPIYLRILMLFAVGYALSHYAKAGIAAACAALDVEDGMRVVLSRFSALAYALPYLLAAPLRREAFPLLRAGDFRAPVAFPFIWRGRIDPTWRALVIFAAVSSAGSGYFVARHLGGLEPGALPALIGYGAAFALLNSAIEEFAWRGVALSRQAAWIGDVRALLVNSLLFGLSHYDLGFPLGVCLAFAAGGFFMGGAALRAGGIAPAIAMHLFMNLIFVFSGIIFS